MLCSGRLRFAVEGQNLWVGPCSDEGLFTAAYPRAGLKFFSFRSDVASFTATRKWENELLPLRSDVEGFAAADQNDGTLLFFHPPLRLANTLKISKSRMPKNKNFIAKQ